MVIYLLGLGKEGLGKGNVDMSSFDLVRGGTLSLLIDDLDHYI